MFPPYFCPPLLHRVVIRINSYVVVDIHDIELYYIKCYDGDITQVQGQGNHNKHTQATQEAQKHTTEANKHTTEQRAADSTYHTCVMFGTLVGMRYM